MFYLSNPMDLWLKCKHIIKKHLRYFYPSSCLLEPGKECIFNKTTLHTTCPTSPKIDQELNGINKTTLVRAYTLDEMDSFKIITICSKIVQITRTVFRFSERFILKVKTLQYVANGKLLYKTKIILPLAICKLSSFLLLFV
jgi:hypothetical protein